MTLDLNPRPAVMCFFFSGNIVVLDEVLLLKYKADYIVYFFLEVNKLHKWTDPNNELIY